MGTPQRAILKRSNARSCFEPHRSRDPTSGRFARKPTNGGRAFWRPPTGPRDATSNPARPHQILIQGNLHGVSRMCHTPGAATDVPILAQLRTVSGVVRCAYAAVGCRVREFSFGVRSRNPQLRRVDVEPATRRSSRPRRHDHDQPRGTHCIILVNATNGHQVRRSERIFPLGSRRGDTSRPCRRADHQCRFRSRSRRR